MWNWVAQSSPIHSTWWPWLPLRSVGLCDHHHFIRVLWFLRQPVHSRPSPLSSNPYTLFGGLLVCVSQAHTAHGLYFGQTMGSSESCPSVGQKSTSLFHRSVLPGMENTMVTHTGQQSHTASRTVLLGHRWAMGAGRKLDIKRIKGKRKEILPWNDRNHEGAPASMLDALRSLASASCPDSTPSTSKPHTVCLHDSLQRSSLPKQLGLEQKQKCYRCVIYYIFGEK